MIIFNIFVYFAAFLAANTLRPNNDTDQAAFGGISYIFQVHDGKKKTFF